MNLGVLPGGGGGYASGINDAEQIVGYAGTAMAINAGGQIVGSAQDLSGLSDAVLFRIGSTQSVLLETQLSSLDQTKWNLEFATGINDSGQIYGFCVVGLHQHAFLLTPVSTGH